MHTTWQVHKFGGTSVGNSDRIKGVGDIVMGLIKVSRDATHVASPLIPPAIEVSAIKGVTDKLIEITLLAQKKDPPYAAALENVKKLHFDTVNALLKVENRQAVKDILSADFSMLGEVLRGISLSGISIDRNVEFISGFGEVWSAQLLDASLRERQVRSRWLDAREVLVVEPLDKSVVVDWQKSITKINQWLKTHDADVIVITGFVASTADGVPTTLKRNGSDFSASIFGSLLNAPEIFIWTDVDGIFSADPRLVPEAVVLDEISYDEAAELASFGAKVVHPATMGPAMRKNIPIWIRNTFNPQHRGTKIHKAPRPSPLPVKGLSIIDDVALLNVEGNGMSGVPGIAERFFGALSRHRVSVIMVSQGGSEHSICVVIRLTDVTTAKAAVEQAFYAEIHQGLIEKVEITADCNVLAVVGDNMVHLAGVSGRFFKALGQSAISVKAIAQGSSERNISAVVAKSEGTRALRAVHSAFYLSDQTLAVGIIGTGVVGGALLDQLSARTEHLKSKRQIDLRVRTVMNSKRLLMDSPQLKLEDWRQQLAAAGAAPDLAVFEKNLAAAELPHAVIVDLTSSEEIARRYRQWLDQGFNVITANKKANTLEQSYYDALRDAARKRGKYFIYSTNVGAGLPVIQTLRDLHHTGDAVLNIEGVFSGTLSYLFNGLTSGQNFSDVVKEAKKQGYTEPDPRDDLSGMDVARKLVILAREIGIRLELAEVDVENLVPAALRNCGVGDFLDRLNQHDALMKKRLEQAESQKQVLRYVGTLSRTGQAKIELKPFNLDHPFARISGTDNIVAFNTDRYQRQPLIIQGPGAGPQVTAAGVFADLLRLASYLGASQ